MAMQLIRSDLELILAQILATETHAPLPNPSLPFGLRTVDGTSNNVDHSAYGAADQAFPRMTGPVFRQADLGTSYT
ncbi:hypothetical protein MAE02_38790 [Microvirga aerophila]|uniref:Uncharacterized protein n=2 Tax=Microvirga aerophila TaxID=670291 RepID=A0A512BW56_9HYPH|nr:hypothetical protein MAE02_38790 [Microvirga aerophila]